MGFKSLKGVKQLQKRLWLINISWFKKISKLCKK
jgi:hypothetical protein